MNFKDYIDTLTTDDIITIDEFLDKAQDEIYLNNICNKNENDSYKRGRSEVLKELQLIIRRVI